MSPLGIASTLFSLVSSIGNNEQSNAGGARLTDTSANSVKSSDFSSSLALRIASMQSQSMNSLMGSVFNSGKAGSGFDALSGTQSGSSDPLSFLGLANNDLGLSPSGRNTSLFDPESAYRMMTNINIRDINYKAQFAELNDMKSSLAGMAQAGTALGQVNANSDNDAIKSQLQAFVGQYNEWVDRFDGTVKNGGLLAGTQAAEVSLYELKQSVENRFNGAMDGIKGMSELGLTINPTTHLASFDSSKLDAVLDKNRTGAINAISEFSGNFTKSADLLISSNNFIPNRLSNLDRVIDYIADNKTSLKAEFGSGDPARISAQVSKALAAYEQIAKA